MKLQALLEQSQEGVIESERLLKFPKFSINYAIFICPFYCDFKLS